MPVTDEIVVFALGPRNAQHSFRASLSFGETRSLSFAVYEFGQDTVLNLSGYSAVRLTGKQVLGPRTAHVDVSPVPAWVQGRVDVPVSPEDFTGAIAEWSVALAAYIEGAWVELGRGRLSVGAFYGMPDPLPLPFALDVFVEITGALSPT